MYYKLNNAHEGERSEFTSSPYYILCSIMKTRATRSRLVLARFEVGVHEFIGNEYNIMSLRSVMHVRIRSQSLQYAARG